MTIHDPTYTTKDINDVVNKLYEMGIDSETPSHVVVRGLTSKTTYYINNEAVVTVEQVSSFQIEEGTKWTIIDHRKN